MANVITKYREFWLKQRTRRVAEWSTKRLTGRAHYVAGFAIFGCLVMTGPSVVLNLAFNDAQNIANVTLRLVLNFLCGLFVGHLTWNSREKAYLARSKH